MIYSYQTITMHSLSQLEAHFTINPHNSWYQALQSDVFQERLSSQLRAADFSGSALVALFVEISQAVESADFWHEAIYQYALSKTYPANASVPDQPDLVENATVFLEVFRLVNELEKTVAKDSFFGRFPLQLLTDSEIAELENKREYHIVVAAFRFDYIYEMMKLNRERFPYTTLEHISGVHYLAMYIARGVQAAGLPVDLGIVSGAAALHDIGKFGTPKEEANRVAYYHYYYTEEWFYRKGINYIRNIAVNHSTWDLELESLPIESLILIYSDFRVKGHDDSDWPYAMKFYDIAASFDVILQKLDNVDEAKKLRYQKVYTKLADFEKFLHSKGVKTDFLNSRQLNYQPLGRAAFLQGDAQIEKYKLLSIEHSLSLMYQLRNEQSLNHFLDLINQEKDRKIVRRYIQLLDQFSKYLTPNQKMIVLSFLYDLLIVQEEDLRRHIAAIMGQIISSFDDPYSKYLPPNVAPGIYKLSKSKVLRSYIDSFLNPPVTMTSQKIAWLGKALSDLFRVVVANAVEADQTIALMLEKLSVLQGNKRIYLLETFLNIAPDRFNSAHCTALGAALEQSLASSVSEEVLTAMLCVRHFVKARHSVFGKLAATLCNKIYHNMYQRYLACDICALINERPADKRQFIEQLFVEDATLNELHLVSLKSATPLAVKMIIIEIIVDHISATVSTDRFYSAIHFTNLIKNSEHYEIRILAGNALLDIFDELEVYLKNDVVIDLLSGLEIENYQFTKNVPPLLGALIIKLPPYERAEILDDLYSKVKGGSELLKSVVLETIGYAINAAAQHSDRAEMSQFINRLLGVLFKGLVQHQSLSHVVAFNALTSRLFSAEETTLTEKYALFKRFSKKFLTIVDRFPAAIAQASINYAYGYNQLYKFLVEYRYEIAQYQFDESSKVAYFSGAFDPFSAGQKDVVMAISQAGYDVYIDVDHHQWMRRTQPLLLRKRLIEITVADQLGIYLMPTLPLINLADAGDCQLLSELFASKTVYVVAGQEAIADSQLYRYHAKAVSELNHLIIKRRGFNRHDDEEYQRHLSSLHHYQLLEIDDEQSGITSQTIRSAIDRQLDLSDMMDELAAAEVKFYNMYVNEPTYKSEALTELSSHFYQSPLDDGLAQQIIAAFDRVMPEHSQVKAPSTIALTRLDQSNQIVAAASYRQLDAHHFARLSQDASVKANFVDLYSENTIIIDYIIAKPADALRDYMLNLHTEIIVNAQNRGYDFAIVELKHNDKNEALCALLERTGYTKTANRQYAVVSIKSPVLMMLDVQSMLKKEFREDTAIRNTLSNCRHAMMNALVKRYPHSVILAFNREMLYHKINSLVRQHNAPREQAQFGPYICVPYGNIYTRWLLPNSVTKTLHTERVYDKSLSYFDIEASPNYPDVETQLKIIKAFRRPIILIDDLIHRGLRLQVMEPYIKAQGIDVAAIVAGVMTGTGRVRAHKKGYDVKAGYFVHNVRVWYSESQLYPFIGGDAYRGGELYFGDVIPSINRILPYMYSDTEISSSRATVAFAQTCLQMAFRMMAQIERTYQTVQRKPLVISRLNEVFVNPRIPHYGEKIALKAETLPSDMIKNDLLRLKQIIKLVEN